MRAAVTRDDGFWETLGAELNRLLDLVSDETYPDVPVEDRIIAWLCAHDERDAAENFLEYAFDNQNGYPHRMVGDRPHITLPFIDALAEASDRLTAVADVELRYRTRLLEVRWPSPERPAPRGRRVRGVPRRRLRRQRDHPAAARPGLRPDLRVSTTPTPEPTVNQWSQRANEDHSGGAFSCDVDVAALRSSRTGSAGPVRPARRAGRAAHRRARARPGSTAARST